MSLSSDEFMNIELLMIGNEILIGKTQDTNSNWLAKRITKYGHEIARITTIGDDVDIISNALKDILNRKPDIVITSGGLGPTFDDMTLKAVAVALGKGGVVVRDKERLSAVAKQTLEQWKANTASHYYVGTSMLFGFFENGKSVDITAQLQISNNNIDRLLSDDFQCVFTVVNSNGLCTVFFERLDNTISVVRLVIYNQNYGVFIHQITFSLLLQRQFYGK